jgi:hypothetical protein
MDAPVNVRSIGIVIDLQVSASDSATPDINNIAVGTSLHQVRLSSGTSKLLVN